MPRPKLIEDQDAVLPSVASTRKERCAVCKVVMQRVTPGHLREHGLTTTRYARLYGERRAPSRAERVAIGSESDPPAATIDAVADRLLDKKVWLGCLADEVSERMMNGPLRQRLSALLVTMLYQRGAIHGEALSILHPALAELRQEWRLAQGGKDGAPTDTDVLLRIVDRASKLVSDSEDAVQKTIKLALEEQKATHLFADGVGPSLYQGTGEKLDMPTGIPTGDRETIRNLLSLIGKAAQGENVVNAQAVVIGDAEGSTIGDGPPPTGGVIRDGANGSSAMGGAGEEGSSAMSGVALDQGSSPPPPSTPVSQVPVPMTRPPTPHPGALTDPTSGAVTDPTPPVTRARTKRARPSSTRGAPAPEPSDGEARQRHRRRAKR